MKNKIANVLAIVLIIIGSIIILISYKTAGDKGKQAVRPEYGGTYVYATRDKLEKLNPRSVVWLDSKTALTLVFDQLISVSKDLTLAPRVCESWRMISGNSIFECTVRNDIVFHNGKKLTAEDVIFSLNYLARSGGLDANDFNLIEGIDAYWLGKSKKISGISEKGPYNVQMRLKKPAAGFASLLASPRVVVLPSDLMGKSENDFFKQPTGSGPFIFVNQDDTTIEVSSNPQYYLGKPYLDKVVFKTLSLNDAVEGFKSGMVSDLSSYPTNDLPNNLPHAVYYPSGAYQTTILFVNNRKPPFNDARFREFFYFVIDRDQIIKECYPLDRVAYTVIPRGIPGYDPSAQNMINNRSDMEGKYRNVSPVTIYYVKETLNDCAVKQIEESFGKYKLPFTLEGRYSNDLSEMFFAGQLAGHVETLIVKNDDAYSILKFFDSTSSENLARLNDDRIDVMLQKAQTLEEPLDKGGIYRQIDKLINANMYVYPILHPTDLVVADNRYHGNENRALRNMLDFTKIWLEK